MLNVVEHVVNHFHHVGIVQNVEDPVLLLVVAHQLVATEDAQLFGHYRLGQLQGLHDLVDRDRLVLVAQIIEDFDPGAIAQHLVNFRGFID